MAGVVNNMTESLSIELVLVDGNIDQTASLAAFETALVRRATEREIERTGIAEAVSELFDEKASWVERVLY